MKTPSPATVISCVALAVAIGGTGYAISALPKNSVGTAQIKKDAVTGAKIKAGSVDASDLKPGLLSQAAGGQGAAGPQGATGAKGDTGPSGITASAAVSTLVQAPGLSLGGDVVSRLTPAQETSTRRSTGPITVASASRLFITASATIQEASGTGALAGCWIRVDGTDADLSNGAYGTTVAVTFGSTSSYANLAPAATVPVAAGSHDVQLVCSHVLFSGGTVDFISGSMWVTATAQ